EWLRLQETVHGQGIDLGLTRVRSVAERLRLLPYPLRTIIVAGTNGKGSTVACLAALLRAHGLKAGAFTSPHLLRYHERIRVDGADATDAELIAAFEAIDAARGDTTLTFFEYNALAAMWIFRERRMEFAVLEVGLGGRLDAVNIVDAEAAIVCSIGLDHADWLGTDIEQIGREKAGVFRAGSIAVIADPAMTPSVAAEAARVGARALRAGSDYTWQVDADGGRWSFQGARRFDALLPPALAGARQYANAAAAIAALQGLGVALQPAAINHALGSLQLPGRFQVVPGPVEWILDVAHNEPAARVLADNLRQRRCAGRTLLVTGILGDKDVTAIAPVLAAVSDRIFLCGIAAPRGLTAVQLAGRAPQFASAAQCEDITAGMHAAAGEARPGDRIVVCGSFLAVAPALERLGLY
ncbi:MAG TPA: bifunctional tetrahydrofolate synthase/dihydrofolate synthase, partial [Steroidobacteraceae bacterium]|nr:bifunctional tetrahydrofolate synthase/dihydrofolate synthase [Steroidobacteraceae bacterium]